MNRNEIIFGSIPRCHLTEQLGRGRRTLGCRKTPSEDPPPFRELIPNGRKTDQWQRIVAFWSNDRKGRIRRSPFFCTKTVCGFPLAPKGTMSPYSQVLKWGHSKQALAQWGFLSKWGKFDEIRDSSWEKTFLMRMCFFSKDDSFILESFLSSLESPFDAFLLTFPFLLDSRSTFQG